MKPNIFNIATKELNQDAFITWLLQWGNKKNHNANSELQKCGAEFAKRLIQKQYKYFNEKITLINADRQWENIDIWAEVNNEYLIIIEDKINSKQHSDQLKVYKNIAKKWCNNNKFKLVCIYLKTGNESRKSLKDVEKKGYAIFTRKEFIGLLNLHKVENDIFIDFKDRLLFLEELNNQWENKLIKNWEGNDWQGFFQYLEEEMNIVDWGFVNNPSGGFWNAVLNWDYYDIYPLYLQTEQYKLCFKISTDPEELDLPKGVTRSKIRNEICQYILDSAEKHGFKEIERQYPFGNGKYMTVAFVNSKYWLGDLNKTIDKKLTVNNLRKYLEFLRKIIK